MKVKSTIEDLQHTAFELLGDCCTGWIFRRIAL